MSSKQVLLGLIPWMLYAVLTIPEGESAGIVAAVIAAIWAAGAVLRLVIVKHRPKMLDACGLGVFAAFTAIEVFGTDHARTILDNQGRGLAAAVLAAVMLLSAPAHPFTEQYTRSDIPPMYRSSPVFRSVHRDLSIRWGCTIAFVAVSYLVEADVRAAQGSDVLTFVLTWIVPIGAVAVAARQSQVSSVGRRAAAAPGSWPEPNTNFFRSGTP